MISKTQGILGLLQDRRLIEISGDDAASFLQGLVTTDIEQLAEGNMMAGALLSPQGKVLFDFLVGKGDKSFFLDTPQDIAEALVKRLSLYKLRSEVEIMLHEGLNVAIGYQNFDSSGSFCFIDKRFVTEKPMIRHYLSMGRDLIEGNSRQEWDRIRIAQAIAESGMDFALGEIFPHEINLDQIGGLSFKKGCYIGQEVVSRIEHRGTARRRLLLARSEENLPPSGTIIEAGAKPLGAVGSSIEGQGLALVRLDRVQDALDKGLSIHAAGVELILCLPERVNFSFPQKGR